MVLGRLVPLYRRHTVLAGTKGDMAGALYRALLQSKTATPMPAAVETGEGEWPEGRVGDECVVTRMIFQLARRGYRIVRVITPGLVVLDPTSGRLLAGGSNAETEPCDCQSSQGGPHCRVWLPLTAVDDEKDEERVNCALTQIISSMGLELPSRVETQEQRNHRKEINEQYEKEMAKKELALGKKKRSDGEGARQLSPDVETRVRFAEVVLTTHTARYFDPSRGVEIVGKLAARPEATSETQAKDSKLKKFDALPVEVFAFRFLLTARAVVFEG